MASVVFLPGCNYRCPYCHNHALVLSPGALDPWPLERVLDRLEALRGWVDGVCVSGGEPTLHEGLADLVAVFRGLGLGVKLDTNGSRPGVVGDLLAAGLVDAVSLDLKAPLEPVPYRRNAGPGSEPEAVAETLRRLAAWGGPVEVRTTVHPDLLSRAELCRLAAQAGLVLRSSAGPVRSTPQRCRPEGALEPALRERPGLAPDEFEGWTAAARQAFASGETPETLRPRGRCRRAPAVAP